MKKLIYFLFLLIGTINASSSDSTNPWDDYPQLRKLLEQQSSLTNLYKAYHESKSKHQTQVFLVESDEYNLEKITIEPSAPLDEKKACYKRLMASHHELIAKKTLLAELKIAALEAELTYLAAELGFLRMNPEIFPFALLTQVQHQQNKEIQQLTNTKETCAVFLPQLENQTKKLLQEELEMFGQDPSTLNERLTKKLRIRTIFNQ